MLEIFFTNERGNNMNLEDAVKYIIDGDAVLFVGAGFSKGATNIKNTPMKDAKGLCKDLCEEMKVKRSDDLAKVSNLYLGQKQDKKYYAQAQKMITKLQDAFLCATKGYLPEQRTIALQDWMRIYTTNYDDVIERIYEEAGKEIVPMTLKNRIRDFSEGKAIIHLNGLVRNLDVDKLDDEFKLTTRSYLIENFNASEIKQVFQQDLRNARAIIFVGTSLGYDLEVQRVIYGIEDIQDKVIFIDRKLEDGEEPDPFEVNAKRNLGELLYQGTSGFAKEIERVVGIYKKKTNPVQLRSFRLIDHKKMTYREATKQSRWNLLTVGKAERDLVYSHLDDDNYLVRRDVADSILRNVRNQKGGVHIIHSNLGNGKSCLMQYLMCRFAKEKMVFEYVDQYADYERECREITRHEGEKVIFFESYNLHLKAIERLKFYLNEDVTLILSCRTFLNYHMIYDLAKTLNQNVDSFLEYDIDRLSNQEKEKIVLQFQNMPVAEFKDKGKKQGVQLLDKCGGNWAGIAIYYFKTEQVSKQLDQIYGELAKDSKRFDLLLGCIINNVVGLNLLDNQLYTLLEISQREVGITRDANINEMVGMYEGKLELRSAILSLFFIRKNGLYKDVMQVMEKMIRNADMLFSEDAQNIKRLLISISNISELFYKNKYGLETFKEDDLQEEIIEYFGKISDEAYYKKNQFFWLQYAMACMDLKKYEMAENNFKLSYQYAKEKRIESYQIDVQYGRFLLEKGCISELKDAEAFKIFREAHSLWQKVLNNKEAESYYVYRQITVYQQFLEKNIHVFKGEEFNKSVKMIDNFIKNINRNKRSNIRRRDMENSVKKLEECRKLLWSKVLE